MLSVVDTQFDDFIDRRQVSPLGAAAKSGLGGREEFSSIVAVSGEAADGRSFLRIGMAISPHTCQLVEQVSWSGALLDHRKKCPRRHGAICFLLFLFPSFDRDFSAPIRKIVDQQGIKPMLFVGVGHAPGLDTFQRNGIMEQPPHSSAGLGDAAAPVLSGELIL
ncbi:MAG: hypothetical protein JNK06_12675 [Candidatus Accumulibacter phosphatis]|uniref:hypothetical protein n=1 Tax=Candidatus Accumulibacter phosphatis TaxID=327160 RepID=UPI001A52B57D|nr:hypothetical protein [Candidatus Accumulibacter phosphatis]